jgi:AraC-like DNA-binding protein
MQLVDGEIIDAECDSFAEVFERLAERTPEPANVPERLELKWRFMELTERVGSDFHDMFHRTIAVPCAFLSIESTARIWFDSVTDPRQLLAAWASTYAAEFARHHALPPAWKAARALRQRFAQPADIGRVAWAAGASRSALDAGFKRTFGMAPVAYHARVRLAHGLTELRDRATKVDDAARLAGFASVKNFNRAVGHYTAMTPSDVRGLPRADFERLLRNELLTDSAALAARTRGQRPEARGQGPGGQGARGQGPGAAFAGTMSRASGNQSQR